MFTRRQKHKIQKRGKKEVLTKTEDFRLYVIRCIDKVTNSNGVDEYRDGEIRGTVLLTEAQAEILTNYCGNRFSFKTK